MVNVTPDIPIPRRAIQRGLARIPGHQGLHAVLATFPVDNEWHTRARQDVHLEFEGEPGAASAVDAVVEVEGGWALRVRFEPGGAGTLDFGFRATTNAPAVPGSRFIRRLGLGGQLEAALAQLNDVVVAERFLGPGFAEPVKRPGRAGRPDVEYAMWARRYVDAVKTDGRRPVSVLVEQAKENGEHLTPAQVRWYVGEARSRGLLTDPPKKGHAGGELTAMAKSLLAQLEPDKSRKTKKKGQR